MTTAEKEFVISHVFIDVSSMENEVDQYSPTEEHFGVPWCTCIVRDEDCFVVYLHCLKKEKEREWSIEIRQEGITRSKNGIINTIAIEDIYTDTDEGSGSCLMFIKRDDLMNSFVIDDTFKVEIRVKIKRMTGINLRKFDESMKQFSDIVLVVENQKFYISKLYLASHSPYFEALFLRNFKESNQSEIPLEDVNAEDFQKFLELLHGESSIDDSSIEGIVHLADMYDAKFAIQKCEQYLIKHSEKTLKEKLQLAHRYRMQGLKHYCLSKITTSEDIRSVMTKDMDPSVVEELLQKSLALNDRATAILGSGFFIGGFFSNS